MSKFKKTCFTCGNKVDKLIESRCEECYREEFPAVKEIKPVNIRFCNTCKKIYINNNLIEKKEIEERLLPMIKKNIHLNNNYTLENVKLSNFKFKGSKIIFDTEIETELIK